MNKKIGLTIGFNDTQFTINKKYIEYVRNAGFTPVLITPVNDPIEMANMCDGLLLPGGIDIDPTYYGYDNISSWNVSEEKDNFERSVFHAFIGVNKPVFGICRGFQLIAREYLSKRETRAIRYLQDINGHAQGDHGVPRGTRAHKVNCATDLMYGTDSNTVTTMFVNSLHHQALIGTFIYSDEDGNISHTFDNLVATAWTSKGTDVFSDARINIIEGFIIDNWNEDTDAEIGGVQWHPEELNDVGIISSFFNRNFKEEPASATAKHLF